MFVLLLIVMGLCCAVYSPAFQDYALPKILNYVNSTSDMHIEVAKFRLRFPVDIDLEGVEIFQKGDTLLTAGQARVDVAMLPLFSGDIDVNKVNINDAYFKSGSPDSVTYIRARLKFVDLSDAGLNLSKSTVDLDRLYLDGGVVDISLRNDTTPPTPPTPNNWLVKAKQLSLNNVDVRLAMLSTGDSIAASLSSLDVGQALVDLKSHNVEIGDVDISRLDARYLTAAEPIAPTATPDYPSLDTVPWTVKLTKLRVDSASALYARQGYVPATGFDMNYVAVSRLQISADSLYNRGPIVRVPLRRLSALERSGLPIDASGLFEMDATQLRASDFNIATALSALQLDATYGLTGDASTAPISISLAGDVDVNDISTVMPEMKPSLAQLPYGRKMQLQGDVSGTLSNLEVNRLSAEMRDYFSVALKGRVAGISDFDTANGDLTISGNIRDVEFIEKSLAATGNALPVNIPPMTLDGDIKLRRGTIDGQLQATTSNGRLALDATFNGRRQAYDIDISTTDFPVNSFMPRLALGRVTVDICAKGHGFNPVSSATMLEARVDAINVNYNRQDIRDITVDAQLGSGNAAIKLMSSNPTVDLSVNASGNLSGAEYDWTLTADVAHLDMHALGLSDSVMDIAARLSARAAYTPKTSAIVADVDIADFDLRVGSDNYRGSDVALSFDANNQLTSALVTNRDLRIAFESPSRIEAIIKRFGDVANVLTKQLGNRVADVEELQQALPQFSLDISSGTDNILSSTLADRGISFDSFKLTASNDSLINISGAVEHFVSADTRLDHVTFSAKQRAKYLIYNAVVDNDPGTMDDFAHVQVNGYIADDKMTAFVKQKNIAGETGYHLGGVIDLGDSTMTVRLVPYNPIIGYKNWIINNDNYITVDFKNIHVDANLLMHNSESSLHIYTEHDSLSTSAQEDIVVKIDNVKIADWLAINPYAVPMRGNASADMRFALAEKSISGTGKVTLSDFYYGKQRVGDLEANVDLSTGERGLIYALTSLSVDGQKVMSAKGVLNDSTAVTPMNLDFEMKRFPLALVNPFIGPETATFTGYLDGQMDITGRLGSPQFDGYLRFDSAAVKVATLGTTFRFSDTKLPVDSGIIRFSDYEFYGVNSNPLCIDGTVDVTSLSDIALDLKMKARQWQVVGNNKRRSADVYGKAFINFDATARGSLKQLNADVSVLVLPETNVTYVLSSASSQLGLQSESDMVRFVNFADTTQVMQADSVASVSSMSLNLNASLRIAQGSTICADLSSDGKNKVQVKAQGNVDFTLGALGDMRTVGRISIDDGFVRYTPPLMSEKLFNFQEGSTVAFTGDITNPVLNIKAVDRVKANVTQEGQNSRLINFDVALSATGTPSNLNVAFDMSTDDDVTVENELQAMSPEQRANQAMNLLLYNVYTGPGTKASSNLAGNPLYSFLESQLNTWMANNVKGVDISFGIDQYNSTVDGTSSTTTSYSYRVSKTFLNDRFKIVVGGNYSTDADADENFSQNLINDISFEYMLNRSGSMYVRLFRHTGYESILEGEVTQTGVGFVYKRKLNSLRDLFRFGPRRIDSGHQSIQNQPTENVSPSSDK
jgi:hypothetical protein